MSNCNGTKTSSDIITEVLLPIKFDNMLLELEFYKKKNDALEKDLFKCQTQNIKNENIIKKLQEMVALYGKNTNNTSNSFLLPSEFKSNWEILVKDLIMEAFERIYDTNIILAHIVQETFKLVYEEAKIILKDKIHIVLNSLNVNEIIEDKFLLRFRLLFQEYFEVIFSINEEFQTKIRESLKDRVSIIFNTELIVNREEDVRADIESKGFITFIEMSLKLCLYMHLHDTPLSININHYEKRNLIYYYYYNKSDFMNIEGFAKDQSPCIVILPPPLLRSSYAYQGIKPAVYIVQDSELIKSECEKNKLLSQKGRTESYSELIVRDYSPIKSKTNKELNMIIDKLTIINNEKEKQLEAEAEVECKKILILNNTNSDKCKDVLNSPKILTTNLNSCKYKTAEIKPKQKISNTKEESNNINLNAIKNTIIKTTTKTVYAYDQPLSVHKFTTTLHKRSSNIPQHESQSRELLDKTPISKEGYMDNDHSLQDNFKYFRSNSHKHYSISPKKEKGNSSHLESFNNSIIKDDEKGSYEVYNPKSSMTYRNNPNAIELIELKNERGDGILNERLNYISNSFVSLRNKSNISNDNSSSCANNKSQQKDKESQIKYNSSSGSKKYHMTNEHKNSDREKYYSKPDAHVTTNLTKTNNNTNTINRTKNLGVISRDKYSSLIPIAPLVNQIKIIKDTNLTMKTNYEFGDISRRKSKYLIRLFLDNNDSKQSYFLDKQSLEINNSSRNKTPPVVVNETNYDSIDNVTEPSIVTKNLSLNRNNSQASLNKSQNSLLNKPEREINLILNPKNTKSNNNNSKKPSTEVSNLNNNISPRVSYTTKIKAMVEGLSNNNYISKTSVKPQTHLEYITKDTNINTNRTDVMFNGNYDYFKVNQTRTTPNLIEKNTNNNTDALYTETNYPYTKSLNEFTALSSRDNQTYDYLKQINGIKNNSYKKDEFEFKLSKTMERIHDKQRIPDVQFNYNNNKNVNNYIIKKDNEKEDFYNLNNCSMNLNSKLKENSSFNLNYKDKIMKSSEINNKTHRINFNSSNAFMKNKKL